MKIKTAAMPKVKDNRDRNGRKQFNQTIYYQWCKVCGICIDFCPANVLEADNHGKPQALRSVHCTGCRLCELHCPDFAITIKEVNPLEKKKDRGE